MERIDLAGERFGRLTVIETAGYSTAGLLLWKCLCDCGMETLVRRGDLRGGRTNSCGCLRSEKTASLRAIDITGVTFGRLTVLSLFSTCVRKENGGWKGRRWLCQCTCGKTVVVGVTGLYNSHTQSCGCLKAEANKKRLTTHGLSWSAPEYGVWCNMRARCEDPNNQSWMDYGGRGIKVCQRWAEFAYFLMDAGPRPSGAYSLDRYPDNDGDYEPGNVRWATAKEQRANQRFPSIREVIELNLQRHGELRTLSAIEAAIGELIGPKSLRLDDRDSGDLERCRRS